MTLVLDGGAYLVGQLAGDLGGVDALDVVIEALPLGDPGPRWVGQGDEALEDLARAALDGFRVVLEVQEVFAVGAAFVSETLLNAAVSLWEVLQLRHQGSKGGRVENVRW